MMYVTSLFRRVEQVTKESVKLVSSMNQKNKEYSNYLNKIVIKHFLNDDYEREMCRVHQTWFITF